MLDDWPSYLTIEQVPKASRKWKACWWAEVD